MTFTDAEAERKYNQLVKLSEGFDAFLYDCDGTLADSMPHHVDSYIRVAATGGVAITSDIIYELAGWPVVKVIEEINVRYNSTFDPEQFAKDKEVIFLNELIELVQPIEYVVNHMKAHAGKVKIAVVSGSIRESVEKTLKVLGIDHLAEVMVCAGETKHGKPAPDPFLRAAELLGVAPERCLVFEDAEAGTLAAEAAGMKWVRIDKMQ